MKIRAPSAADSPIIESWGAVPVQMSIGDTHQALTTGIIDGILVGSSAIGPPWNLHEPGDFITTNIPASVAAFYLIMNTDTWNGLSDQQKAWVDEASGFDLSMSGAEGFAAAGERGLKLAAENGLEVIELDGAAKQGFLDASQPAITASLDLVESRGATGPEIVQVMQAGL
jgi:TRAP-type C4-dicarboxylate transport system substrate-binding protein